MTSDDWFDEPEPADAWSSRVDRLARERQAQHESDSDVDDWLGDKPAPAPDRSGRRRPSQRALLVAAGLLIVALFAALAAAGVFSGGGSKPAQVSTPAATTTNPAPTTTAVTQPETPTVPTGPLKPGDHGSAVTQLQRALKQAGYSPGTIDGVYGPATTQAVTQFQQANGLTADGIAGAQTLAALEQALQSG